MSGQSRYVPELDGLRGIAILLVIPHNVDVYPPNHNWLMPFSALAHAGWIGVQLFFVLSGFLITTNLVESRGAPNYFSAFFGRRTLRIFPLYFLTLIFFLFLLPSITDLTDSILNTYQHQIWLWLFLQNWAEPFGKSVYWFPHFWSLAVEEQFYLVWPFIVALLPDGRLLKACIGIISVAFLIRIGMLFGGVDADKIYQFTICRMDALAFGAIIALIFRKPSIAERIRRHGTLMIGSSLGLILIGALITHVYGIHDPITITVGYTALGFAMAVMVAVAAGGSITRIARLMRKFFSIAVLRSVGKYSYAMYIFHLPLSMVLWPKVSPYFKLVGTGYPLLYAVFITLLTYGMAVLSYFLLERHFLKLKRYFVPATSTMAASAA